MENKFGRSTFRTSFWGSQFQQHRASSTICMFEEKNPKEMECLFKSTDTLPEAIVLGLLDVQKQPEEPQSRMANIRAACVPLFNTVRDFFRKNLTNFAPGPKEDCTTDFSNSSVYMGLVTSLPPPKAEPQPPQSDLVDLSNFTVIHTVDPLPQNPEKTIEMTDKSQKPSPEPKAITKSDLNVAKIPTRRQKRKTCQNTQKSRKTKHTREKMRKNVIWDIRDELNSEEDAEEDFEDVLSQEISSSIEDGSSSLSPHASDYVCDFIASIPSSQPSKPSPCAFVKNVLRMDIPFSPKRRPTPRKTSADYDSDDSFIIFGTPDSTSPAACDRIPKFRACDRRRRLSEESDDSYVMFLDDKTCPDDPSDCDSDETCSEASDSEDDETYPIQLDSGFEERKVSISIFSHPHPLPPAPQGHPAIKSQSK